MTSEIYSSSGQRQFNTLAQSGTTINCKKPIIVKGNGTDLSNNKALIGRTKKKMINQKLILCLIDVAKSKRKPERIKAYWNTFYCQYKVVSSDHKLYGNYCKNRFCNTCCGIRKAEIINKYLPFIKTWEEPYFVTLTMKSVSSRLLKKRMGDTMRAFRIIKDKYRKLNQKGKGIKLVGIKSLECNFNPISKIYNPHLHIITANKETAEILIKEWLSLWTKKYTYYGAQKSIKINNLESALIEIIKYSSKIFTNPEMKKESKIPPKVYVSALDNIIWAMKSYRIFDRFGFDLPCKEELKESKTSILTQYKEWKYDPEQFNWVDSDTEKLLSEYEPELKLKYILNENMDLTLE